MAAEGKHVLLVIVAITAAYFGVRFTNKSSRVENVLAGLLKEERSVNFSTDTKIAVGFGSCLDLFVDGIPLMDALGLKPPDEAKYHDPITNLQELAETFAFFLSNGAAAERFISNDLLAPMVKVARAQNGARWAAGGNAPVISSRFAKEGYKHILVGTQASETFKSYYTADLQFVETLHGEDDIHLILEYKVGEKWGKHSVNRANRFVVHSDENNPYLRSLEGFREAIKINQPRLVVVSALQMLDNYPFKEGAREERMEALRNVLVAQPESTLIHFEMASFSEVKMMKALLDYVIPYSDSLGMNEQELPNVVAIAERGEVIDVADSNPRTATVLDDMRQLYQYSLKHSKRGLSRIHVHTLAFQAILTKKSSQWKYSRAGAARASLTAFRHVCGMSEVDPTKAKLFMDDSFSLSATSDVGKVEFKEHDPVSCWDEHDYEICVAPVLVCTHVKQTCGGGDNITPAGLIPQI